MKKINYGLIVSDFDGTLASGDVTVSEKNRKAIFEYINAGGVFVISTGRLPCAILSMARELGLEGLLACSQGTIILDIESGDVLLEERLSLEATLAGCRKLEEMGLTILAFDLWDYYSNKDNDKLSHYESVAKAKAITVTDKKLSDFLEEKQLPVYKLVALVDPEDNAAVYDELLRADLPDCGIIRSMDFLVEIVNATKSKGTALEYLAERYGVPMEKTVAVGDNLNDISMIERAAVGVAVANAEKELKDVADYISEHTNDESAVAHVIEKFGLER